MGKHGDNRDHPNRWKNSLEQVSEGQERAHLACNPSAPPTARQGRGGDGQLAPLPKTNQNVLVVADF